MTVGRKPKSEQERRNRSAPVHDWAVVVDAPYAGAVPNPGRLPVRTQRWWQVVSRMPHCVLWSAGDWEFAVGTAYVHAAWVKTGLASAAAELRRRERTLGLTAESRRDLRIRYVAAEQQSESESPISLAERRRELQESS